jgi:hypothetical protein
MNSNVFAQKSTIKEHVNQGFTESDASKIGNYFAATVSVEIEKQTGSFNKQHATSMLKSFFIKNPCKSFKITNSGKVSNSDALFIIARYESKEKAFRVYILYESPIEKIHSFSILVYENKHNSN